MVLRIVEESQREGTPLSEPGAEDALCQCPGERHRGTRSITHGIASDGHRRVDRPFAPSPEGEDFPVAPHQPAAGRAEVPSAIDSAMRLRNSVPVELVLKALIYIRIRRRSHCGPGSGQVSKNVRLAFHIFSRPSRHPSAGLAKCACVRDYCSGLRPSSLGELQQ